MSEIRCIAIDDEPLALEQIKRYIGRIHELKLVGTCLTVQQAKELMATESIDLIFLDIEMPQCNGMDFAKSIIDTYTPISIIFTTAYPQFAVEGFRLDAVDYLLKPLAFEDMEIAVEKVKRRMSLLSPTFNESKTDSHIFVKASGAMHKVSVDDILYIKGLSEYVQICVRGESKLLTTHDSLKRYEELLPKGKFMRIHKSYLINLSCIEGADTESVTVGGTTFPIGQKYRPAFKEFLKSKQ